MSQPLYFLAGVTLADVVTDAGELNGDTLERFGIAETFSDVRKGKFSADLVVGPDDRLGVMLVYRAPQGTYPKCVDYRPMRQTWIADCNDCPLPTGLWVGYDKAEPPTAGDMLRNDPIKGHFLQLGGQSVMVPIVRTNKGTTSLRCDFRLIDGKSTLRIKDAELRYWEAGAVALNWILADGMVGADIGERFKMAVLFIGRNYRFSRIEQNVLRWLDSENFLAPIGTAIDLQNTKLSLSMVG